MDEDLSEAVSEAFVRLHEKGLVYRGEYMVNWAPMLKTAVSDLEVEYSEEEGKLYYFKYVVEDGDDGKLHKETCVFLIFTAAIKVNLVNIVAIQMPRIPSCCHNKARNYLR